MGLRVVTIDQDTTPIDCTVPADAPADAKPDHYLASYSADVRDALDALAQLGGIVKITRLKPDEWHVCIGDGPARSPMIHSATCWAETLPLAICRAAIASVEVPV
jgi:hypothetical protein